MKLVDWKKHFAPHILSRGEDYYDADLVEIEAMDGQFIEATVEGTDTYCVEITLKNDHVAQMECDCPYAAGGNNCKHMAAVLFAADDTDTVEPPLVECITRRNQEAQKARNAELEQAIAALSEAQIRSLLSDAAKKHSDIWDRITMIGKPAVDVSTKKRWAADLRAISRRASDRSGFIDYYHANDFTSELDDYMTTAIAPLLENRLIMDAFDLVGMVFTELMSQEIDDSDGGLGFVASSCETYWEELIPAPEADQSRMLDWFLSQIRLFSGDVGEDFLWPVVFEQFTDEKLLPKILSLLDQQINNANEYALEKLVTQRIDLMERIGSSSAEVEAYRKRFWVQPFIRKLELDRLEREQRWKEALGLLKECEELDAQEDYLLAQYSERRVRILKQSGPEWAWLQALKRHVFSFRQQNLERIMELKQAVPGAQWQELLWELFQNENTRSIRRELQRNEGLFAQMMTELEASRNSYELAQYEKDLRKLYPERVRDLWLTLLDTQMKSASSRSTYARIVQALKHLYGYPEGREQAKRLASSWREAYPRRSAMLDELKKAKL